MKTVENVPVQHLSSHFVSLQNFFYEKRFIVFVVMKNVIEFLIYHLKSIIIRNIPLNELTLFFNLIFFFFLILSIRSDIFQITIV